MLGQAIQPRQNDHRTKKLKLSDKAKVTAEQRTMPGYPRSQSKPPQAKTGYFQTEQSTVTLGMAACVVRGGQQRGKATGAAPRMTQTLREVDRLPELSRDDLAPQCVSQRLQPNCAT